MSYLFYLVATCNTKTGDAAYLVKLKVPKEEEFYGVGRNSSTPEMLWKGISDIFSFLGDAEGEEVSVILNNEYVIDAVTGGRLHQWKDCGWLRGDGSLVKHIDLLKPLEENLLWFEQHSCKFTLRFPETVEEKHIFNSLSKRCKAIRKSQKVG